MLYTEQRVCQDVYEQDSGVRADVRAVYQTVHMTGFNLCVSILRYNQEILQRAASGQPHGKVTSLDECELGFLIISTLKPF